MLLFFGRGRGDNATSAPPAAGAHAHLDSHIQTANDSVSALINSVNQATASVENALSLPAPGLGDVDDAKEDIANATQNLADAKADTANALHAVSAHEKAMLNGNGNPLVQAEMAAEQKARNLASKQEEAAATEEAKLDAKSKELASLMKELNQLAENVVESNKTYEEAIHDYKKKHKDLETAKKDVARLRDSSKLLRELATKGKAMAVQIVAEQGQQMVENVEDQLQKIASDHKDSAIYDFSKEHFGDLKEGLTEVALDEDISNGAVHHANEIIKQLPTSLDDWPHYATWHRRKQKAANASSSDSHEAEEKMTSESPKTASATIVKAENEEAANAVSPSIASKLAEAEKIIQNHAERIDDISSTVDKMQNDDSDSSSSDDKGDEKTESAFNFASVVLALAGVAVLGRGAFKFTSNLYTRNDPRIADLSS